MTARPCTPCRGTQKQQQQQQQQQQRHRSIQFLVGTNRVENGTNHYYCALHLLTTFPPPRPKPDLYSLLLLGHPTIILPKKHKMPSNTRTRILKDARAPILVLALWNILPICGALTIPKSANLASIGVSVRQVSTLSTGDCGTHTLLVAANESDDAADPRTTDELLSELTELTQSFEYVQSKVENNAKLYREMIESLQSKISKLEREKEEVVTELEGRNTEGDMATKLESDLILEEAAIISTLDEEIEGKERVVNDLNRQLEDAKSVSSSSSSDESLPTASDGSNADDAAMNSDLTMMREEWEEEKRALIKEKSDLAESIVVLKKAIHEEAEMMRSEMKKEYIELKANAILEREEAERQSEAAMTKIELERQNMPNQLPVDSNKKKSLSLRKRMTSGWKRLMSMFRLRRKNK